VGRGRGLDSATRSRDDLRRQARTIDGVGPLTAATLIAELGDPARLRSAGAIASYVGVAPRLRQSGKKRFSGSPTIPFGNAVAQGALDGGPQRRAVQSVAAAVLRTASGSGQTWQGRCHRGYAKAASSSMERRYAPTGVCAETSVPSCLKLGKLNLTLLTSSHAFV
jgi:hypothetical protein